MSLKDNKIYFINYSKLCKYTDKNKNNDIKALGEFIYWLFQSSKIYWKSRFNFGEGSNSVNKLDKATYTNTYELVDKLHNEIEIIDSPDKLSTMLQTIINSITNPINNN